MTAAVHELSLWAASNTLGTLLDADFPAQDFWFGLLFYNIALLFIKLTFLFQYYRIVAQVRKLRLFYVGMMIVIGGWQAAQCFLILFACFPVERFWDKSIPGTCFMNAAGQDLNAIGNIVTDFVVLILPLPVLLRLSLRPAQKWSLVGVFCLGFTWVDPCIPRP